MLNGDQKDNKMSKKEEIEKLEEEIRLQELKTKRQEHQELKKKVHEKIMRGLKNIK